MIFQTHLHMQILKKRVVATLPSERLAAAVAIIADRRSAQQDLLAVGGIHRIDHIARDAQP